VVKKIVASCDFSEQEEEEEEKENEIKNKNKKFIFEWMENIFLFSDSFNKKLKGKTLKIQNYLEFCYSRRKRQGLTRVLGHALFSKKV